MKLHTWVQHFIPGCVTDKAATETGSRSYDHELQRQRCEKLTTQVAYIISKPKKNSLFLKKHSSLHNATQVL
jgi:hypothetical protein